MSRVLRLIAILLAISAGSALANTAADETGFVGKPSPAFDARDIAGNPVGSAKLFGEGKVVVLNFWGLRCGACLEEMPTLNALQDRHKDAVVVLGVNNDGIDAAFLARQIEKGGLKIRYTVIPDPEMKLVDLFKMTLAPLTLVMDPKGTVRYRHENYVSGDEVELEAVVRSILEGK